MGAASVGTLLVALAVLAPAVMAQSCDDELPAQLAGNFSGLACAPVWNNFVLRYVVPLAIATICEILGTWRSICGDPVWLRLASPLAPLAETPLLFMGCSTQRTMCCGWCCRPCTT